MKPPQTRSPRSCVPRLRDAVIAARSPHWGRGMGEGYGSWRAKRLQYSDVSWGNEPTGQRAWCSTFRRSGPAKAGTPNERFMDALILFETHWDHEPRATSSPVLRGLATASWSAAVLCRFSTHESARGLAQSKTWRAFGSFRKGCGLWSIPAFPALEPLLRPGGARAAMSS
jgi:hypothetical protein